MQFSTIAASIAFAATAVNASPCVAPPPQPTPATPAPRPACPAVSFSDTLTGSVKAQVYDIIPSDPERASTPTNKLNVYNISNDVKQQAVVFRGLPETAYACRLSWNLKWPRQQFAATKNTAIKLYGLTEIPDTFSASSVTPLVNVTESAAVGALKLGAEEKQESIGEAAGFPPCATELAYLASLNTEAGGEGALSMLQDQDNGFSLYYNYC
ncbi:unnamed protein product [Periconia digitata]|uniref:Ubiquitin 3 binding protein But2 C-terminal domain-containing protein n=1 Tax=Periconia digitata TaxID=1303443 RepID=A0A9W4UG12_9PLEO|nr:unnamed protein product [Periconia digitata]